MQVVHVCSKRSHIVLNHAFINHSIMKNDKINVSYIRMWLTRTQTTKFIRYNRMMM